MQIEWAIHGLMRIGNCLRKLHYLAALVCSSRLLFVASELVLFRPQPKSSIGQEPESVEAGFHAIFIKKLRSARNKNKEKKKGKNMSATETKKVTAATAETIAELFEEAMRS